MATTPSIRIGKTIIIKWHADTTAEQIAKRNLTLELRHQLGTVAMPWLFKDGAITTVWQGAEQHWLGNYTLTLWENKGLNNQTVTDSCNFVNLVRHTCLESLSETQGKLSIATLEVNFGQGGSTIIPTAPGDCQCEHHDALTDDEIGDILSAIN